MYTDNFNNTLRRKKMFTLPVSGATAIYIAYSNILK